MKEFPVGSVCIVTKDKVEKGARVGLECTILEGLQLVNVKIGIQECYRVELQTGVKCWAMHETLKLKRFPGQLQSWAADKVKELFKPNSKLVEETV
jgi:hypothetical protein